MRSQVKRALFSVDNLKNIEKFAIALKKMEWHIIATKETSSRLRRIGIDMEDVADFTGVSTDYGFPPTLHSKIEAALTLDVPFRIDLVYDITYPYSKGNDVGGHTLLALAVKGDRISVSCPEDMEMVIEGLRRDRRHRHIDCGLHRQLLDKANAKIAAHYLVLANRQGLSDYYGWLGRRHMGLLNGENPYQKPADLFVSDDNDPLSLGRFILCSKSIPCFTNLADLDCIIFTISLAAEAFCRNRKKTPYIVVAAKHGNACGMAVDWESPEAAITKALFGNPKAIWGGECITNFKINARLGHLLYKNNERRKLYGNQYWMLDLIAAPNFDKEAVNILSRNPLRKLLKNEALYSPKLSSFGWHYRKVRGGILRQPLHNYILDIKNTYVANSPKIKRNIDSLILAWSVVYSSYHGGNEVALVKNNQLLGVGGGPSTVDAATTAVLRARSNGHNTDISVFAADAFFPFTDVPEMLRNAGCCAGIFPIGGKNEQIINRYFKDNRIGIICLPSQYRGFCRH